MNLYFVNNPDTKKMISLIVLRFPQSIENLPSLETSIIISWPSSPLQISIHSEQSLGIPEQDPPKDGGKQDPRIGPLIGWLEDILTEQPLSFRQV